MKSSPPHSASYLDPAITSSSSSSALKRSKSGPGIPRSKTTGQNLTRSKTDAARSAPRLGSHFGRHAGGYDAADTSSNSIDEEEDPDIDEQEWGLRKGMELFEVSAKDDFGNACSIPML